MSRPIFLQRAFLGCDVGHARFSVEQRILLEAQVGVATGQEARDQFLNAIEKSAECCVPSLRS